MRRAASSVVCFAALSIATGAFGAPSSPVAPGADSADRQVRFVIRSWRPADGLPQSSVTAVTQTPDGFLWVGTRAGLARFDGLSFSSLPADLPVDLGERAIAALAVDGAGTLWVALRGGGVVRWDGRTARHLEQPRHLISAGISAMHVDRDGTVWLGGWTGGLARLDPDGRWTGLRAGLPSEAVFSLLRDRRGTLWVGTYDGLARLGPDGRFVADPRVRGVVHHLAEDGDGALWVSSSGELRRLREDGASEDLRAALGGAATGLFGGPDGEVWVATAHALARWTGTGFERIDRAQGLPEEAVHAVHRDREGSLWVGFAGEGLAQVRPSKLFGLRLHRDGVPVNANAVLWDRAGALWIGADDGRVLRSRGGAALEVVDARDGQVWSLAEGADGAIWAGHADGDLVRHHAGRAERVDRLEAGIRALQPDRAGALWIALNVPRVLRRQGERVDAFGPADGLELAVPYSLHEDRQGRLLVGQLSRVSRFEDGRFVPHPDVTLDGYVVAMHDGPAGALWIATGVGLYRLAPDGRLARFGRDQGLRADAFGGVLSDERGHLWVCTRRGLLRLPYADLDAVAAGRAPVVTPARYGVADGMPSAECAETAQPLAARAPDGSLWFATRRGVVAVDPARAFDPALSAPPPVPVIDVVSAPGRRAVGAAEVTLPPRAQELLRFAFTAPTFVSPEAVSFRYRLDPLSEDWLVAGAERTAQFANVRPGTYTFRVVARGASGGDAPGEARVVVHVQPRFTQTPWFAGLIFVGAAAAFGLMYRARQRRLHRQVLAVVAERGRIARDLHDDLNASLMGIKLQLDAAVTLWPDAPEEARRQLEAARAELPRSLAETRRSIWMLRPARLDRGGLAAAIEGFLDQAARGAGIDTAVSARGDARTVGADVEEQAFRIVQEAVTNALKHAQARRIEVEVAVEGRRLQVTVDDDGRGLGAGPAGAAGRFGLAGMTERARAIGGAVAVGPRPGGGTRVCLQVDLGVRAAWRRRLRRLGAPRYVRNWR